MAALRAYNEMHTEVVEGKGKHGKLTRKPFTPSQIAIAERLSYIAGKHDGIVRGTRAFMQGTFSAATFTRGLTAFEDHGFLEREWNPRGEGRGSTTTLWPVIPSVALEALERKRVQQESENADRESARAHRNLPPSKRRTNAHSDVTNAHSDATNDHFEQTNAHNDQIKSAHSDPTNAQSDGIGSGSLLVDRLNSGSLSLSGAADSAADDAAEDDEREHPVLDAEILEQDGTEPDTSDAETLLQQWTEWAREDNMVLTGTPAQQLASVHKILETVPTVEAAEVIWRVFQKKDRPCYRRNDPQWAAQDWARFTSFQAPPTKTEANIRMFQNLKDRAVAMDRADAAQSDAGSSQAAFDDKWRVEPAPRPATVVAEYRPEPKGPAIAPKHFEASGLAQKWMEEYPALRKAVRIRFTLTERIKAEGWTDVEQALAAYVPQAAAS